MKNNRLKIRFSILMSIFVFLFSFAFVSKTFAYDCYDNFGNIIQCDNEYQNNSCTNGYWDNSLNQCVNYSSGGSSSSYQNNYCVNGYWDSYLNQCVDYTGGSGGTSYQNNYCTNGYWDNVLNRCVDYNGGGSDTSYQNNYCVNGYWDSSLNRCVTINPYIPPTFQQPGFFQPAYSYPVYQPQPAYSYGASFGFGSSWGGGQQQWGGGQQQQMMQCWNGTYVYNLSQCPAQTQTCWNGSIIPINQTCPAQTQRCPNGQIIPINQICPAQFHTCWNGITLPLTQSCPAQYQTCWNGSVIPVTQTCPIKTTTTTTIIKEVQIITHSVVTNIPTKVSQTSAECNGVALISGRTQSVGWFEFGTTESLGKTTNSADIGSASQSSFSNVISGLKAGTRYYCRAVIANRDGTYRGKIVSFRTLAAAKQTVVYAAPKKSVKTKTKTEFVCSDGSIAVARTVSIADTLNSGGKLLSIKIERSSPDLVQGSIINYRISITNDSDTAVTGVEAKIVLPTELVFMDATTTAGVTVKDNVMTVPIGGINSKEVKTFILPVKVSATSEAGKAVITTVYASYNLPVTGSQIVKDEVSSYMTANIVANGVKSNAKNASSSVATMLFPQNLLGWLVLFAVILIIVVLVMNIRRWIAEKKLEKEEIIHHHKA